MKKILIRAEDRDVLERVSQLTRISPGFYGGIAEAAVHRRSIWAEDKTEPLFLSGGESIYEIERGYSFQIVNGVVNKDWRVTANAGSENCVRLRIIIEGEMSYPGSNNSSPGASARCSFAMQPAHKSLSVGVRGGSVMRSCVMSISERFLRDFLGASESELPGTLIDAWRCRDSSIGSFPVSRQTLSCVRRCMGMRLRGAWAEVKIRAMAYKILNLVFSDWMRSQDGASRSMRITSEDHNKLVAIKDHVTRNFRVGITAEKLCREFSINRNKLHYGFKHLFGVTPHDYCVEMRMRAALDLLLETRLAVAEIAWEVGFGEPTNFTAAFRRYFGVAPSAVRAGGRSVSGRNEDFISLE